MKEKVGFGTRVDEVRERWVKKSELKREGMFVGRMNLKKTERKKRDGKWEKEKVELM